MFSGVFTGGIPLKTFMNILLRGLVLVLPALLTIAVICWLGITAESLLETPIKGILGGEDAEGNYIKGVFGGEDGEGYYIPGMGILAGFMLVLIVGILAGFWVFNSIFAWLESLLGKIPLVKTLYGSIKDLMGFFPGGSKSSGFKKAVIAKVAGVRMVGIVTREDFNDLPEALHGENEVMVYFPMSYQLGGFTVRIPTSDITPIELSVAEAMRFQITGGMSTTPADGKIEVIEHVGEHRDDETE